MNWLTVAQIALLELWTALLVIAVRNSSKP